MANTGVWAQTFIEAVLIYFLMGNAGLVQTSICDFQVDWGKAEEFQKDIPTEF